MPEFTPEEEWGHVVAINLSAVRHGVIQADGNGGYLLATTGTYIPESSKDFAALDELREHDRIRVIPETGAVVLADPDDTEPLTRTVSDALVEGLQAADVTTNHDQVAAIAGRIAWALVVDGYCGPYLAAEARLHPEGRQP